MFQHEFNVAWIMSSSEVYCITVVACVARLFSVSKSLLVTVRIKNYRLSPAPWCVLAVVI